MGESAYIVHTVFFKLKEGAASIGIRAFYEQAVKLANIPGVLDFKWVNELSPKNIYKHGLFMRFACQDDYDAYSAHPEHVRFVNEIWIPNVSEFQEIDYLDPSESPAVAQE